MWSKCCIYFHYPLPTASTPQEPLPSWMWLNYCPCTCVCTSEFSRESLGLNVCVLVTAIISFHCRERGCASVLYWSVPLIVISIICTNTNCVNTREHGSPQENTRAIDSMRDMLLLRVLRLHSIIMIIGYWECWDWPKITHLKNKSKSTYTEGLRCNVLRVGQRIAIQYL